MFEFIISAIIGYLLGAIPFALVIVKFFSKKDIRSEGSGNVGAMNSYDITGKKWLGVVVLLLDLLKGFIAPLLSDHIFSGDIMCISLSSIFVIVGHNFNAFLGFKGGRGLAPAAGVSLYINSSFLIVWLVFYAVLYFGVFKNVHISSLIASLMLPLVILIAPSEIISSFNMFLAMTRNNLLFLIIALITVIVLRHIEPLFKLIKKS